MAVLATIKKTLARLLSPFQSGTPIPTPDFAGVLGI
ncbi:hypothetical protein SPAB_02184 [Salmonella enterica subsp. enterica serovar Paratyphi B str. SPB7]|uniref:Uncharacterized protein n=1 Tax=Salmonella paratyphi B (strain ATCC BAA-1250 / SPB7) TaxID=1016998 RepID=A0A6C6Z2E9_SALPB|nr:hypothetical protein SPAB_02184 [Salmonella enterica subsp. enterica serovar Paratyphi B str. SPB7]